MDIAHSGHNAKAGLKSGPWKAETKPEKSEVNTDSYYVSLLI